MFCASLAGANNFNLPNQMVGAVQQATIAIRYTLSCRPDEFIILSQAEHQALLSSSVQSSNSITTNFDYQLSGQFFAFGFTAVLSLYLISHVIGLVIKTVRDK